MTLDNDISITLIIYYPKGFDGHRNFEAVIMFRRQHVFAKMRIGEEIKEFSYMSKGG